MTKKTTVLLILPLLLIIALIFVVQPRLTQKVSASPSENNTSVFTGQFLPAFLGGAYDPAEAYKRIAGLPVYVFGYDRWAGSAAMVINNYAIRTQIRADGSFQVQGLPTAAHYAVYFPYKLNASGGVERTDCVAGAGALDPCANDTAKTAEFRWPDDEDQIKDVFSYAQGDASAVTIGNTQVDNQQVKLGKVFLTNETRVDIVNHINVFPLVPNKSLKIVLRDYTGDSSFEVVAQRISEEKTELQTPINFPIIRGRTSSRYLTGTENDAIYEKTFQAYAPSGRYVINYWRNETNSATYKEWNLTDSVKSVKSGLALEKVYRDWRPVLLDPFLIGPAWTNGITLWGVVTGKDGYLMDGTDADHPNVSIGIKSDLGEDNSYGDRTYPNYPEDPTKISPNDFYAAGSCDASTHPDWNCSLPTKSIWGIYGVAQNVLKTQPSQTESPWVYVAEGNNYKTNPANPGRSTISSLDGPVRIDLVASKGTHPSGYDSGLVINTASLGAGSTVYSNASARIATNLNGITVDIPALTKVYSANRLGQIYIPDLDLKRDQDYMVEIRAGDKFAYSKIRYPAEGYFQQNVQLASTTLNNYSESYKILGLIPVPFIKTVIAAADGKLHGKVQLVVSKEVKLINAKVKFETTNSLQSLPQSCETANGCGILKQDGTLTNDLPAGLESGGEFEIVVPQPPPPTALREVCNDYEAPGSGACPKFEIGDKYVDTYKITISGTLQQTSGSQTASGSKPTVISANHTFGVNSKDTLIPPFMLTPTMDCEKSFEVGWSPDSWGNAMGRIGCSLGLTLGDKIGGFFKFIYQEGLIMRSITNSGAIVQMWGTIRGLANIFFVILLIVIGIATILRLEPKTYNLGILLPRLFINIALANFSLLIVQLLIDTSNVLTALFFGFMENILSQGGYAGGGAALVGSAKTIAGAATMTALTTGITGAIIAAVAISIASGGALGVAILSFLLSLILSVVVFILGLFLLFLLRYVGVWVATVLAPLLFVLNVLPSKTLSGLSSLFWNTILPLIFMGPVMAFIFGIGISVLTIGGSQNEILAGLGTFAMGLITLGMALKVPEMLSGMFKGGLMSASFGGKEGTGGMAEGLVAGRLGAKDMDTLKKERLNAPAMEGFAERGKLGGGRFGALGGVVAGLTGRQAMESARAKTAKEALNAEKEKIERGLEKPGAEQIADQRKWADLAATSGIRDIKETKAAASFLASGDPAAEIQTGGRDLLTGDPTKMKLRDFVMAHGGGYNEKGELADRAKAVTAFAGIREKSLADAAHTAATPQDQGFDRNRAFVANLKAAKKGFKDVQLST